MDATHIFRPGFGAVGPRPNHHTFISHPQQLHRKPPPPPPPPPSIRENTAEADGNRIAHTLTACCRCRQRKTRCDPTLPRCLPCERSGSTCEYLDAAKGRRINRYYVVRLQDKVRALEAELSQYTDDENEYPKTPEELVRPGGMVRLNPQDETPRYLGPSSGIAMTRLLMEQAKRYTESNRISELFPEVRARQARMQSIQMTGPSSDRRKSYPMTSECPAESLPRRDIADKLVEVFIKKSQVFWPAFHEKDLEQDVEAVYNGDSDPYKRYVVQMVIAIGLQKLEAQYAGLADSYYLAAMQHFEDVVRPRDLKTLQCLVLIGLYSLLTPTRTPVYFVVGLATRICQQEGLTSEKTIGTGYNVNAKTIDMRRRLMWIVAAMEYGLAHSMGRPNNFAAGDDRLDVDFFSTVEDDNITEDGINPGPPSERKLVAIHFYKMRLCQAEIRRSLYERKRPEPKSDTHPWYAKIEKMNRDWLDSSPESPDWCKPWFTGRYHQMRIFMYRPSPQVPKPSARAAKICYESAAHIINLSKKQMESASVDISWVFLLVVNMALNTLLWTVSYPEVRQEHPRQTVETLVNVALDVLGRCSERWPGTAATCHLYTIFSKACFQSYETRHLPGQSPNNFFTSPSLFGDHNSSPEPFAQTGPPQAQYLNPPQFGYVFDSPPESMNIYTMDPNFPPPQPTFRSNSIFFNPASTEMGGRRFSYFPPDFMQPSDGSVSLDDPTPPATTTPEQQHLASPPNHSSNHSSDQLPTPPDTAPAGNMTTPTPSNALSPPGSLPHHTPNMAHTSPVPPQAFPSPQKPHTRITQVSPTPVPALAAAQPFSSPKPPAPPPRGPAFAVPPTTQPAPAQRPLPATTIGDWFSPPPPFISPFAFGNMSNSIFNDTMTAPNHYQDVSSAGLGLQNLQNLGAVPGPQFDYNPGRQGSLTQSQQLELMNVLETEGMDNIDAFLNGNNIPSSRWY